MYYYTSRDAALPVLGTGFPVSVTRVRISAYPVLNVVLGLVSKYEKLLEMWANDQRDGRLAEHRWRPLFNVAKFG